MNKSQIGLWISALVLLVLLYAFMPTRPKTKKGSPTSSTEQPLNDQAVLLEARKGLDSTQQQELAALELLKNQASSVSEEVEALKKLSSQWNTWRRFDAGAYYAEKVAELANDGDAWSMAGTSYGIAYQSSSDIMYRRFAARKAIAALEKAIQAQPDSVSHQINEALMYVELSSVDETVPPMTGAQKLLALDSKYPNNVRVSFSLAQLSMMRSGDYRKAINRLQKLTQIPDIDSSSLLDANFMLVNCYKELKMLDSAALHYERCIAYSAFDANLQSQIKRAKQEYLSIKEEK